MADMDDNPVSQPLSERTPSFVHSTPRRMSKFRVADCSPEVGSVRGNRIAESSGNLWAKRAAGTGE
jgi:hypothetical protein